MKGKRTLRGKGMYLWLMFAVIMVFAACPVHASAKGTTPYAKNGRLSVKNGHVVNSKGKVFVIKGVSTHGIAWFPEYVNKSAFQTLRDKWGVNTVRLAMYTAEYGGYCTGGNQTKLKKLVDDGVRYASELGMYVIIDWHILSDGNPLTYRTQAKHFFQYAAKRYAKKGNVLFEICNEPNGAGGSWVNVRRYANSVIKTIRKANKKAIVIVGTPTWSQDVDQALAKPLKKYKNLAYAFHFYAGTHKSELRGKLETVLKKHLPVVVTEFGISEASGNGSADRQEGNRWMKLLDKYGVGRVCWNLSNKSESSALLKSSCKKTGGFLFSQLTVSGKWLVKTYTGKGYAYSPDEEKADSDHVETESAPQPGQENVGQSEPDHPKADVLKNASSSGKAKIQASLEAVNSWSDGKDSCTQYRLILRNKGKRTVKRWTVTAVFEQPVQLTGQWSAAYQMEGGRLTIKPLTWNKKLRKKQTAEVGFILKSAKAQTIKSLKVSAGS